MHKHAHDSASGRSQPLLHFTPSQTVRGESRRTHYVFRAQQTGEEGRTGFESIVAISVRDSRDIALHYSQLTNYKDYTKTLRRLQRVLKTNHSLQSIGIHPTFVRC